MLYCVGFYDGPTTDLVTAGTEFAFRTAEEAEEFLSAHPRRDVLFVFEVDADWESDTIADGLCRRVAAERPARLYIG